MWLNLFIFYGSFISGLSNNLKLLGISVASNETDGFKRFELFYQHYQIDFDILGLNTTWLGGDVTMTTGGGYKVRLLREHIQHVLDSLVDPVVCDNLVILFTDAYDVVISAPSEHILAQFALFDARVVFSAEHYCWPDMSLCDLYPHVQSGYRYLNSGAFIGYVSDLAYLLNSSDISDTGDDQLFYTKVYLNETLRNRHRILLDTNARLFQNLHGVDQHISIGNMTGESPRLYNNVYRTSPVIFHGNGNSKIALNNLADFLQRNFTSLYTHEYCYEDCGSYRTAGRSSTADTDTHADTCDSLSTQPAAVSLSPQCAPGQPHSSPPTTVCVALMFVRWYPFLTEYCTLVHALLSHTSRSLYLHVHVTAGRHSGAAVTDLGALCGWRDPVTLLDAVVSYNHTLLPASLPEHAARNGAVEDCLNTPADYMFIVDNNAHLTDVDIIEHLILLDRDVVSPLLRVPYFFYSNFWGDVLPNGYYKQSFHYMSIVRNDIRGVWNVPYISTCMLFKRSVLVSHPSLYSVSDCADAELCLAYNLRKQAKFMYLSNLHDYGYMVHPETKMMSNRDLIYPELWQVEMNQWLWEQRYLHQLFRDSVAKGLQNEMPCPDVYWLPLFTTRFANELIETMENFGQWSSGSNEDSRIDGGYENVPTRDIHMKQLGVDREWLKILDTYVRPLQESIYLGYSSVPVRADLSFVVRYRPDEQPSLRPHHDASTYTINVALNTPGVDYLGGGTRFLRYNCSVTQSRVGWAIMSPGRLTHMHEGLATTYGTRYILISFIDP